MLTAAGWVPGSAEAASFALRDDSVLMAHRLPKRSCHSRFLRLAKPELATIHAPAIVPASGNGRPTKMPAATLLSHASGLRIERVLPLQMVRADAPARKPTVMVNGNASPSVAASFGEEEPVEAHDQKAGGRQHDLPRQRLRKPIEPTGQTSRLFWKLAAAILVSS